MRRCHDCRRRPRRRSTALVARAVSFVEIDARSYAGGDCAIHPSICVRLAPSSRSAGPSVRRSFVHSARWRRSVPSIIIASRRDPIIGNGSIRQKDGRIDQLRRRRRHLRVAAFPGRNMCHSDWQLQCTCALWLVRGGVINSHQYDQDSTVKPPTHGRGIVRFERVSSLLSRCDILISFAQFNLGNELCSAKISGNITIPLFPFPIVTWLLRWSSLVLFTVAILRDVARRHCRPIRREANSNNKRADRQATTRFAPSSSLIRSWAFVGHDCYAWGASTHARVDPFICPIIVSCLFATI